MKKHGVIFSLVAVAASSMIASAYGAQISMTGAHTLGTNGSAGPIGINSAGQQTFTVGSGNDSVTGTVRYSNTADSAQQCFELTLTNFVFTASGNTNKTITINVVQDFVVSGNASTIPATASHQMNGFVSFAQAGQLATGYVESTHESVALPRVEFNPNAVLSSGAGEPIISRGTGTSTNVSISGTYRMVATYVFTLNAAGSVVSVRFPDSIVDNACLVLVPVQHVATGAIATLGLAFTQARRMRRKC